MVAVMTLVNNLPVEWACCLWGCWVTRAVVFVAVAAATLLKFCLPIQFPSQHARYRMSFGKGATSSCAVVAFVLLVVTCLASSKLVINSNWPKLYDWCSFVPREWAGERRWLLLMLSCSLFCITIDEYSIFSARIDEACRMRIWLNFPEVSQTSSIQPQLTLRSDDPCTFPRWGIGWALFLR